MIAWAGKWIHILTKGHEPEWFVMYYDDLGPHWKCKVCTRGRPIRLFVGMGV